MEANLNLTWLNLRGRTTVPAVAEPYMIAFLMTFGISTHWIDQQNIPTLHLSVHMFLVTVRVIPLLKKLHKLFRLNILTTFSKR